MEKLIWKSYDECKQVQTGNSCAQQIVERLGKLAKCPDERNGRTFTNRVMEALTLLGDKYDFNVYSHYLSEPFIRHHKGRFKNREWLYDLHWYTEHALQRQAPRLYGYRLKSLPLVAECEWNFTRDKERDDDKKRGGRSDFDPYGEVKYDFQKLLVSNAGLRLMIFKKRHADVRRLYGSAKMQSVQDCNEELDDYFVTVIEEYLHLEEGSQFLFARYKFASEKAHLEFATHNKLSKSQPLPQ